MANRHIAQKMHGGGVRSAANAGGNPTVIAAAKKRADGGKVVEKASGGPVIKRFDKGGRVARRICSTSPHLRSLQQIVSLNPCFAEWMSGFPIGWTELEPVGTPHTRL